MSHDDIIKIANQTPSLMERSGVRLKICGMKYPDNILDIVSLQPDYLGFIFYEKSSRFFSGTIPSLPENIKKVGVFVNASKDEIVEKVEKHSLDLVQLHGEETPEFCKELRACLVERSRNPDSNHMSSRAKLRDNEIPTFAGIIKAFPIKDHFNFDLLKPYESVCDYFLFDTKGKDPGGNGYTFDWEILQNYPSTKPYFLSGGIGLEEVKNVQEFLRLPVRQTGRHSQDNRDQYCIAIDVNSKFEIEPGLKDLEKLKVFKKEIKLNL